MTYRIVWTLSGHIMSDITRKRFDAATLAARTAAYDAADAQALRDRLGAHYAMEWAEQLTRDSFAKGDVHVLSNARIEVSMVRPATTLADIAP